MHYSALEAFLPWLTATDYERALEAENPYSDPVGSLRRTLVETRVYDQLAASWIEKQAPDLTILYIKAPTASDIRLARTPRPGSRPCQPTNTGATATCRGGTLRRSTS